MNATMVLNNNCEDDDTELLALEQLLCHDDHDNNDKVDTMSQSLVSVEERNDGPNSLWKSMHNNYMDSSDDDETPNVSDSSFSEYGSNIYKKLKQLEKMEKELKAERDIVQATEEIVPSLEKSSRGDFETVTNKSFRLRNQESSVVSISQKSTNIKAQTKTSLNNNAANGMLDKNYLKTEAISKTSVCCDPVFGLRIINPLISSAMLIERMVARKNVPLSLVASHVQRGDLSKDWVIGGVLVKKSTVQMSKTNKPYIIWTISDLRNDIKFVSLFLFNSAYKELWKTCVGTCIAILNPNVFEKRADNKSVACFSVDNVSKVMVLGKSKDMGFCKARKRDGEICNALVNLSECDTCVYHLKQAFSQMSKRAELQSPNAGRGLNELRNKVLGKSEVFYGGRSYSAVPASKSLKHVNRDMQRLSALSDNSTTTFNNSKNNFSKKIMGKGNVPYVTPTGPVSKVAESLCATEKQRVKDLERLKTLQKPPESADANNVSSLDSCSDQIDRLKTLQKTKESIEINSMESSCDQRERLKALQKPSHLTEANRVNPLDSSDRKESLKERSESIETNDVNSLLFSFDKREVKNRSDITLNGKTIKTDAPKLSRMSFFVEINSNERKAQLAKIKALEILKRKPIEKSNPNSIRGTSEGKRKALDDLNELFLSNDVKRKKFEEEQRESERISRIEKIMAATSSHRSLVEICERREQDKYFHKLEKKEALEEKMLNTYKIPCKAVICKVCNYTAFSAADRCKKESHPIKIIDATKRFFQCKDCGNRTATVFRLPKISCKNCQSSNWKQSSMIREQKFVNNTLSIRGDEETFIGSILGKANLDLLVPEN